MNKNETQLKFNNEFSRRRLLFGAGAAVALTALTACEPLIPPTVTPRPTETPRPAPTPEPTRTPYPIPTLKPGKVEQYVTSIPFTSVKSTEANFEDVTELVKKQDLHRYDDLIITNSSVLRDYLAKLQKNDEDWFDWVIAPDTREDYQKMLKPANPNERLWVYFDHNAQKYFSGFFNQGREQEILGWKKFEPQMVIPTQITGRFGYSVSGENNEGKRQQGFVLVDIDQSKKH
jgi:hypothetical protein